MASEAPDPRTFRSWEDAFQYPIPTVRKLEQQLRITADDNREKLRSLVGASYRSLLDTAESIIDMKTQIEQVEAKLGRVGQNCNTRVLDKVSGNVFKMDTYARGSDVERYTFASQLSVLRNAPSVKTRLMRKDDQHLLVAKVLVISRLVHKALSQSKGKPPIVDQLWEKLLSARRKLLRRIDRRLASTAGETTSLVESMCAYALATSSTPSDVLKHFHKVRKDKMVNDLRKGEDGLAERGINALRLCIQTCQDTQTIFPRQLADVLAKLKAHPLIQDPEVRGLYELNLDVHDRWIGDEVQNYTPWPRHDELERSEAERLLHRWSKDTIAAFMQEVKAALRDEDRLAEVASLRQELIETWMLSGPRMAGVKFANVLDDLRDTMNEKLEAIVRKRTEALQDVIKTLTASLGTLTINDTATSLSLWNTTIDGKDLGNGAHTFKTIILNTHQGRNEAVLDVTAAFDDWMNSVLEVKGIVKNMKEARWDDTFVDDIEEVSDDDDLGESKQILLSADDPRLLENVTQEAIGHSLQNLGKSLSQVTQDVIDDKDSRSVQKAIFVLRVIRDFGDRIPRLRLQERSSTFPTPFTTDVLKPLHATLAVFVAHLTMPAYEASLDASIKGRTQTQILWEGNPALPSQPSPSAFRFLREVNRTMTSLGSDLWAPASVAAVKSKISSDVTRILKKHIEAIKTAKPQTEVEADTQSVTHGADGAGTNVDADAASATPAQATELRDQRLKQLTFDALYMQHFFNNEASNLQATEELIKNMDVADLNEANLQRLRKNATDYTKKTYLLFALLA
ncbi:sphingolipid c9-methyltransferase [Stagonosporopsis vannaccii]|nr:sphingolipid c9-methyltransferase [Stagonosporopsis vannaccii]